jgi:hypothetical protein
MPSYSSKAKDDNDPAASIASSGQVTGESTARALEEQEGLVSPQLSPRERQGSVLGLQLSPRLRQGSALGPELSPQSRRCSLLRQGSLQSSEDGRELLALSRQGSASRRSSLSPMHAPVSGATSSTVSALRAAVDEGNSSPSPSPYPYFCLCSFPCPHPVILLTNDDTMPL